MLIVEPGFDKDLDTMIALIQMAEMDQKVMYKGEECRITVGPSLPETATETTQPASESLAKKIIVEQLEYQPSAFNQRQYSSEKNRYSRTFWQAGFFQSSVLEYTVDAVDEKYLFCLFSANAEDSMKPENWYVLKVQSANLERFIAMESKLSTESRAFLENTATLMEQEQQTNVNCCSLQ